MCVHCIQSVHWRVYTLYSLHTVQFAHCTICTLYNLHFVLFVHCFWTMVGWCCVALPFLRILLKKWTAAGWLEAGEGGDEGVGATLARAEGLRIVSRDQEKWGDDQDQGWSRSRKWGATFLAIHSLTWQSLASTSSRWKERPGEEWADRQWAIISSEMSTPTTYNILEQKMKQQQNWQTKIHHFIIRCSVLAAERFWDSVYLCKVQFIKLYFNGERTLLL